MEYNQTMRFVLYAMLIQIILTTIGCGDKLSQDRAASQDTIALTTQETYSSLDSSQAAVDPCDRVPVERTATENITLPATQDRRPSLQNDQPGDDPGVQPSPEETAEKSTKNTLVFDHRLRDSYEVWTNNLTKVKLIEEKIWPGDVQSFAGGKYKDFYELADLLIDKLDSSSSYDVERASYYLGKIIRQEAILALSKGLSHDSKQVRANAASILGYLKPNEPKINRDLVTALKDTEPIVRRNASLAIGNIQPLGVAVLFAVKNLADSDPNEEVRKAAEWAAWQVSQALQYRELIKQLDLEVCPRLESMIETIVAVGTIAIPDLSKVIRDPSESLRKRANAIAALSQIKPVTDATIQTFRYVLQSDDFDFAKADIIKLMIKYKILHPDLVPLYEELLEHESYLVRAYAAGALSEFDSIPKRTEPKLRQMLIESQHLLERLNSMLALKALESLDEETILALKHIAATDRDQAFSSVAKEVLETPGYVRIRLRPFFSSDLPDQSR